MTDHDWGLPESENFIIKETEDAGRGIYARKDLAVGTHILITSPNFSPTAYVILRPYRREVCAHCFGYDRGREWKIRLPNTSLSFCSEDCQDRWVQLYGSSAISAHEAVEKSIQRSLKRQSDADMQGALYSADAVHRELEDATHSGQLLRVARESSKCSKAHKQLLRQHMGATVDADIMSFLLSTSIGGNSPDSVPALMSLADNPSVYMSASLDDHTQAFLTLMAVLPIALLDHLSMNTCHEYVSRASHNAFSIRPTADGDHSGEFLGYGVWPEASFFNHSCSPNVKKTRIGRLWSFEVAHNVGEGEELCITYLGGEERELDALQRRQRLRAEWGFDCCCRKCVQESSAVSLHGEAEAPEASPQTR